MPGNSQYNHRFNTTFITDHTPDLIHDQDRNQDRGPVHIRGQDQGASVQRLRLVVVLVARAISLAINEDLIPKIAARTRSNLNPFLDLGADKTVCIKLPIKLSISLILINDSAFKWMI